MTQEQIVDSIIIDMLDKKHPNILIKQKIENARQDLKRFAMLSIMDDNRRLFEQYKDIIRKQSCCIEYAPEIVSILRNYIKVADTEVKEFGEVMTPLTLVNEMMDQLPTEVWSNPNLKWLDPCNGVGTYPSVIVQRLMEGLKDLFDNPCDRYKHIIENMIYVCEIQAKNMFLFHCAFDREDEHTLNTYYGSFLDEDFDAHMRDVWKVDKFDIVVGNPPYNISTKGGNGGRDLWDKFVKKGLDVLLENGFLVYVHPPKWRSPENDIFSLFKSNNLRYLEIHSKKDGIKVFGAATRYDFYILQKCTYKGTTLVVDELGNTFDMNICEWDWLPNYNFDLIKTIISKEDTCEVIYSRTIYGNDKPWMSDAQNEVNSIPCIYGMYKDGSHSYKYSSIDKGHIGIPKVIVSCGEVPYPYNDNDGIFGIMNNAFGLKIESREEGDNIIKAMNDERFTEILKSTKWSNFQINQKMFKSFRKDFWKEFL
jgi:hypothetical protein